MTANTMDRRSAGEFKTGEALWLKSELDERWYEGHVSDVQRETLPSGNIVVYYTLAYQANSQRKVVRDFWDVRRLMSRDDLNDSRAFSDNDRLDEIKRRARECGGPVGLSERINSTKQPYLPTAQKQHVPQNLPPAAVHTLVPPSAPPVSAPIRPVSSATSIPDRPVPTATPLPDRPVTEAVRIIPVPPLRLPSSECPPPVSHRPSGSVGGTGSNTIPVAPVNLYEKIINTSSISEKIPLNERLQRLAEAQSTERQVEVSSTKENFSHTVARLQPRLQPRQNQTIPLIFQPPARIPSLVAPAHVPVQTEPPAQVFHFHFAPPVAHFQPPPPPLPAPPSFPPHSQMVGQQLMPPRPVFPSPSIQPPPPAQRPPVNQPFIPAFPARPVLQPPVPAPPYRPIVPSFNWAPRLPQACQPVDKGPVHEHLGSKHTTSAPPAPKSSNQWVPNVKSIPVTYSHKVGGERKLTKPQKRRLKEEVEKLRKRAGTIPTIRDTERTREERRVRTQAAERITAEYANRLRELDGDLMKIRQWGNRSRTAELLNYGKRLDLMETSTDVYWKIEGAVEATAKALWESELEFNAQELAKRPKKIPDPVVKKVQNPLPQKPVVLAPKVARKEVRVKRPSMNAEGPSKLYQIHVIRARISPAVHRFDLKNGETITGTRLTVVDGAARAYETLFSQANGLLTTSSILKFVCPFTKQRLQRPVRGKECKHIECFGLEEYCTINRGPKAKFRCPLCNVHVGLKEFVEDDFFLDLMTFAVDEMRVELSKSVDSIMARRFVDEKKKVTEVFDVKMQDGVMISSMPEKTRQIGEADSDGDCEIIDVF